MKGSDLQLLNILIKYRKEKKNKKTYFSFDGFIKFTLTVFLEKHFRIDTCSNIS